VNAVKRMTVIIMMRKRTTTMTAMFVMEVLMGIRWTI